MFFASCLFSSVMSWQLLPTQASSSANIWASQTSLAMLNACREREAEMNNKLHKNARLKDGGWKHGRGEGEGRRRMRHILININSLKYKLLYRKCCRQASNECELVISPLYRQNLFIWTSTHKSNRHLYWSGSYFLCFGLISSAAFGRTPKSSSAYSRWPTYLHDANVHTWLDFVISVIVLISQSQLAPRKNSRRAERVRRRGGGMRGGTLADEASTHYWWVFFLYIFTFKWFVLVLINYRKCAKDKVSLSEVSL